MKGLTVTKIVKEISFVGVQGELEAKSCFQRQSFTKYLRLTLANYGKSLISVFQVFCTSINEVSKYYVNDYVNECKQRVSNLNEFC